MQCIDLRDLSVDEEIAAVLPLIMDGRIVLISGRPGAGKTTLCRALSAATGAVHVGIPGLCPRSTAESRRRRVDQCLVETARGRAVLLDACAATSRTLAYWVKRLPITAVIRLERSNATS